ncbi:apolipoprotein N-acyltransferase [Ancylobacter defluvii]|uniref:Apolipoprotein N-acyltransferase n=1 Tax=Ancylobacter defluvii TaxID=1282440 RepID=A0A9W6NA73_9HYPH|nr:apolipoprotein N-acyltransferase [Ancylobacter defluvii]MBS7590432.1 apolipoprotein N-acyltransferase [Ancylobacter defluvii]GLK83353.1 apolipoprotein N-acyltransferase [Ancylobacter defluvii]
MRRDPLPAGAAGPAGDRSVAGPPATDRWSRLAALLREGPYGRRALIALAAGAVSALALQPFNIWPLLGLTLPVLVLLLDGVRDGVRARQAPAWAALRPAFGLGWCFGMGYFVAGLWWIGAAFLVQADDFAWLMPFAVLGLPAYLALYTGLGASACMLIWPRGSARFLGFAAVMTLAEGLRGTLLTGFPWNNFGYALGSDLNFAQASAVFGIAGLCLITLACLSTPAALLDASRRWRARLGPPLAAALVLAALWIGGAWRLAHVEVGTVPGVKLRIMQPDLPQDQKFRYDARRSVMDLYVATSESAGGLEGITHLFWPESAFPFFIEREPEALARLRAMLPEGTTLITGGGRLEERPNGRRPAVYNSLLALDSQGRTLATADKVHLVPFGEYLPFQETLEALGLQQLTRVRGGFSAADTRKPMEIPGLPPVLPLICYEAIFPAEIVSASKSYDQPRQGLLLNVSNDAWFGETPGPFQHFEQARMRAIEQGLPLVRATNNGISAIVDPLGRVVAMLPLGARGVLDGALPQALASTIYANIGSSVSNFLLVLFLLLAFASQRGYTRRD